MNTLLSDGIDCHLHLFGDTLSYPAITARTYTPVEATLAEWQAISHPLGIQRAVLVQPSVYGSDNARLIDGLREAGGLARGVAVIDDKTPDDALEIMHTLGVRGLRLNLATGDIPDEKSVVAKLQNTAARIASLGWHLQVLARGALLEMIVTLIPKLPVTVVFDHMAGAHVSLACKDPGFKAALKAFRDGKCWIKISGADHVSNKRDEPEQALTIMRTLVEANPDHLIWGSDWPHIGKARGAHSVEYLAIDHGRLLALLRLAAGDSYNRIMCENPARLYGWNDQSA